MESWLPIDCTAKTAQTRQMTRLIYQAASVTCLTSDACLTAGPGVVSSIPTWSHTFMEIDHEIIFTAIILLLTA